MPRMVLGECGSSGETLLFCCKCPWPHTVQVHVDPLPLAEPAGCKRMLRGQVGRQAAASTEIAEEELRDTET